MMAWCRVEIMAEEDAIHYSIVLHDRWKEWAYQMPPSSYPRRYCRVIVVMQIKVVLTACAPVMGASSR